MAGSSSQPLVCCLQFEEYQQSEPSEALSDEKKTIIREFASTWSTTEKLPDAIIARQDRPEECAQACTGHAFEGLLT